MCARHAALIGLKNAGTHVHRMALRALQLVGLASRLPHFNGVQQGASRGMFIIHTTQFPLIWGYFSVPLLDLA